MIADSSNNDDDDDDDDISTHKEIEKRGQIRQRDLIEAPLIESNIVLDDDSDDDTTESDNIMLSSPQIVVNSDNFPSIIEIVKGSILCNVFDEPQRTYEMNTLQSMSSATKHAKLDRKQHQAFKIICCTFMLSWLDELHLKENHKQACDIVSTGIT
eukprot:9324365-Ditylum_brightwellii.AAC.1